MTVPQRSIHEIDSFITQYQHLLSALPRSHPLRPTRVYCLAMALFNRYALSNQVGDLDKAILHMTESILLQPRSWPQREPNIFVNLFSLAGALWTRSNRSDSDQPEDVIYVAKYLRHLRDQPHVMLWFPRHRVTSLLVNALAIQVSLEAGDVMQDIEEMAVLCHELTSLDTSDVATTRSITCFAMTVQSRIDLQLSGKPSDQVIECLRAVRRNKPDLREARLTLAVSLFSRYLVAYVNDDYEEAASVLDEIITSSSPGDSQDKILVNAKRVVTLIAVARSELHRTPEYSEEAIYYIRSSLRSSPPEEHRFLQTSLENNAKRRFDYFGSIDGLGASPGNLPLSQPVPVEHEDGDLEFGQIRKVELLIGLLSAIRNNLTEVDEAIEKGRAILASSDPSSPVASWLFDAFGWLLFEAFKRTNEIEYLNESISTHRRVFERPLPQRMCFPTHVGLSLSLLARSVLFPGYRTRDLDEGMELLSQCVNDGRMTLPDRIQLTCAWATVARRMRHPSVSTVYEAAVSLMQDALLFAPTLQLQHATLATSYVSHSMPLDYASYRVDLHQLVEAIETLERGRALLWSEMRHLRTSVDQLLLADPQLAHKFAAVNRDLEELTKSIPPSHKLSIDDDTTDALRAVDPFGRLLLKQRSLLKERDKLLSQIQALPGFDSFLTSSSFDTLSSAASTGPVILINHSIWRSDILILLHKTLPSLIPTPRDFYHRASALKDKLLDSRHKYGLDSSNYDQTLASVLAELYTLVGKPVIDRLHQLQVPEQSRIWWCPTSVFCSLPLHAMGPIPSDDGEKRYFLDFYICSYTPTLSALIQSRNRDSGSRSLDRPSILLVAQPDPSLPTVGGEIQVIQALDTEVTSLISEAATPVAVVDGFNHHRFVHFACHGTLEAGKPFGAGFELYGDERLTLLEIVRAHLPSAEFAFLSACHTAEVTEGSVVDEGLHLAAAVQYCGFRSVVGTMWAMVDEDGRELAEHFYKSLFSNSRRERGVPYYERSAKALRVAVKKLRRKKRISLERWVNFVHYGA